ncbi:MAG: SUMF1/EgtB/PvdO family nonheme iron enzyme [Myxococcales bacterium]|nr:SUMF1/EgtB/PvdO family nonheme iron enzyme [Myxococcales bacterium]
MTKVVYYIGVLVGISSAGCENGSEPSSPKAPPDAIPNSTEVAAAEIDVGVRLGVLRSKVKVDAFSISVLPTTVAQYHACVAARACSAPASLAPQCQLGDRGLDGATYAAASGTAELASKTALTCATHAQAAQFCRWVGARLPRAHEWLLAARGPKVSRFAWGESPPTCERHWRTSFLGGEAGACCKGACADLTVASLGQHPLASSPFGLDDVLASPAELIIPAPKQVVLGCSPGSEACVVSGLVPGAIDFVHSDPDAVASFRCVWEQ